ncbi:MAG: hypothetical protein GX910_04215 [Clostridiaceae bacterium]|jgi:hypothetical protein|nr:hypothetical protein [Clostridiaceae bacterium]
MKDHDRRSFSSWAAVMITTVIERMTATIVKDAVIIKKALRSMTAALTLKQEIIVMV